MIDPDWPVLPRVRALVTTRAQGDMSQEEGRRCLRAFLPAEPQWLRQVHGTSVNEGFALERPQADASVARQPGKVCVVMTADCMPVLLADEGGTVVGAAHAGWRGLCAGVIEATVQAMRSQHLLAWLGPAIGPKAYEVGDEVRQAFLAKDAAAASAFSAARPGHWLLDLYAIARQRLRAAGVNRVFGGNYCTYADSGRFYSFRRDGTAKRMAAGIWLQ